MIEGDVVLPEVALTDKRYFRDLIRIRPWNSTERTKKGIDAPCMTFRIGLFVHRIAERGWLELDSTFLSHFAADRLCRCFTALRFPANERPLPRTIAARPLAEKNSIIVYENCPRDYIHAFSPIRSNCLFIQSGLGRGKQADIEK